MDLSYTEEQDFLRGAVRELCAKYGDTEVIRELEDDPIGFQPEFWAELAQMDLLGLSIPAEHGGSGMGLLEQVLVANELGRSIVPSPWFPTIAVAANLLVEGGQAELQSAWLPRIAKGDAILSVAWAEPSRSETPNGIQAAAKRDGAGHRLSGTKLLVPYASSADALLVLARTGTDVNALDWFLVEAGADGLGLEQTHTLAADASYEVTLDDVVVGEAARLGAPGRGWELWEAVLADALVLAAAYAVGGAERTLEMTAEYAKERVQFGVPIGNFQGIAHPIADRDTEISGARTVVEHAAWLRSTGVRSLPIAAMAKRFAAETWRMTSRTGQQTFGGIGFTTAIDVQLYFRRAKQWELSWMGPQALGEIIAAAELDAEIPLIGHDLGV